uniref:GRIP domain-containing protein, putative n=2 Tax=Neospora caninum (strain Liverpool) TaxID=572307 RepID=A0A0F7UEK6_NEOCL|nr:TPA: GRIP domain-containing protein, putative [Neospora caninum Liverpool]
MSQLTGTGLLGALNESPLGASPSSSFLFGRASSSGPQQTSGFASLQTPAATTAAKAASASLSASAAAASSFFSTLTSTLASGTFPAPSRHRSAETPRGTADGLVANAITGGEVASGNAATPLRTAPRDSPSASGVPAPAKPYQLFDEDDPPATPGEGADDAGGDLAEKLMLQRLVRRRERELRAALKRMRKLEETVAAQGAERHQERELLLDVLKQNGLFEADPSRKARGVEAASRPDEEGVASFSQADGQVGCTDTRAADELTEDDALMGIQKLANLLRQLEEENRVLLLFAQMVFPTYPGFSGATPLHAAPRESAWTAVSRTGQQRRPPLDFEDLRTSWLEQEEARGVAAVQAQHLALATAREWEQQAQKAEQEGAELRATVAELKQQVAKVTKEKAHLLVGRLQRAGAAPSGSHASSARRLDACEGRERDLCPNCLAVSAAAARAVEAANAASGKSQDAQSADSRNLLNGGEGASGEKGGGATPSARDEATGGAVRKERGDPPDWEREGERGDGALGEASHGEPEQAAGRRTSQDETRSPIDSEEVCGGTGSEKKGVCDSSPEDGAPEGVARANREASGSPFSFVEGTKESGNTVSSACTKATRKRPGDASPLAATERDESPESSLRAEVAELKRKLEEAQSAFGRHREQAWELLGEKEETLNRLRQKLATLQRQRQGPSAALNDSDAPGSDVYVDASVGSAASHLTFGASMPIGGVDPGAVVQEMAVRQTQALTEIRGLQDALQQAREEVLRERGESERLRRKLKDASKLRDSQGRATSLPGAGGDGTGGCQENVEAPRGRENTRKTSVSASLEGVEEDDGVIRDGQYLRNVLIRYVQYQRGGNEKAAVSLLPVLATVLKMNEDERRQMLETGGTGPLAGAAGALYAVAQHLGLP